MPFKGFEGPAGTGKTHELIEAVQAAAADLQPHQRILALTFMHGSRRRLDERLSANAVTRGRSHAVTLDSFSGNVLRRWQSAVERVPNPRNFDEVCAACGGLLERPEVAKWITATFPIIAVDEAQELDQTRLSVVKALSEQGSLFAAADEFQCLNDAVDTGPFQRWFAIGDVRHLVQVRRTGQQGLLAAGVALRRGVAPTNGPGLRIAYEYPNQMPFSIGHALNTARGTTAILVAPGAADWANRLIPRLSQGMRTPRQIVAPVRLGWEAGASDEAAQISNRVRNDAPTTTGELLALLRALDSAPQWVRTAIASIDQARRVHGRVQWTRESVGALLERTAALHRAYCYGTHAGIPITSIHGAKNRQFRNVVVLWGAGVPGTADHQRRLLYNAITRAEHQCTVFVQTQNLLAAPPFA